VAIRRTDRPSASEDPAGALPVQPVVIEVQDLTKTYQMGDLGVPALQGVSLAIERGEFVAIMGASGSGKSTLMNVLGCLDRPTSGTYRLEGVDVTREDEPALARLRSLRIGFVFQSFNLLPRTTALENVTLPLFYSGQPADGDSRALETLRSLGLAGCEANHPSQLSGGQQQRVAIARALINDPSILLADEPTGNLDSATATDIMRILRNLNLERGLTVVLVTHEPDMAAFADRIVTMRDGVVVSDETTRERRPATAAPAAPAASAESPPESDARLLLSFFRMSLLVAGRAIARNKLRSALTMLGIFIGVAALIAMVAVGQGANAAVIAQIESLGANLMIVLPGATTTGGARGSIGSASTLRVADADAILKEAPAVARVSYMIRGAAQVQYGNKNWNTTVQGVSLSYLEIQNWPLEAGRTFSAGEEQRAARVCLLGWTVFRNLFGLHETPIGATVLVKSVSLQVIGLLSERGQSGFGRDMDDVILIPFSTAENKVLGVAAPSQLESGENSIYQSRPNPFGIQPRLTGLVNLMFVQAKSPELVDTALAQVTKILETRHRIQPGELPDFDIRNISQVLQAREGSSRVMALLLATVASISLLVGGIGIMNILLVSVTERTREIGIRMAIGARRVHVLLQFLVEAVLLSGIGGVAGIVAGIAISQLVSWLADWPTLLSPAAIGGGFFFSAAVGIFFGFYPARRASLLNPIDALRYE
jgi:macrolide transport system ATP-binding/permease protein